MASSSQTPTRVALPAKNSEMSNHAPNDLFAESSPSPQTIPSLVHLPTHILLDILGHLQPEHLAQVRLVSRDFKHAATLCVRTLSPCAFNDAIAEAFPSLETLDLSLLDPRDYDVAILDGLARAGGKPLHLSRLSLPKSNRAQFKLYTDAARRLASSSLRLTLKSLDLSGAFCTKDALATLGALHGLTSLNLREAMISNDALVSLLPHLTALQEIDLGSCDVVDDASLVALGNLHRLRKCDLASCDHFSATGLEALCRASELRTLLLPACWQLNDECMAVIATHATQLECLSLFEGGETVTDAGLASLAALTRLTCLDLGYSCWAHSPEGLKTLLPRLRHLRLLNLGGAEGVRDDVLAGLLQTPPIGLTSLDVSECQRVTAVGMRHLASLPQLRELNAGWNLRLTDDALRGLLAPTLTKLDLSYCADLTDEALSAAASLSTLECLILRRCGRLTDAGLASLAAGKAQLRILNVSHCHGFSSAGVRCLSPLTTLETLNLAGCPRAATVLGLAALATFSHRLVRLEACHNVRLDDGCLHALSFVSQLRSIALRSCPRITDRGLMALTRIERLERLDVDGCRGVSAQGAAKVKAKLPLMRGCLLGAGNSAPASPTMFELHAHHLIA